MYSYKNYIIAFSLLTMVLGCQNIVEPKKPENFINSKDMEEMMYATALLSAARGSYIGQVAKAGIEPECYIEEKFGVDSTTYANNMAYYTTDIDQFLEINERISKRLVKLHAEQDSLYQIEKAIKDSIKKVEAKENLLDTIELDSIKKPILKYTDEQSDSIIEQQRKKKVLKEKNKALLGKSTPLSKRKDSLELVKDGSERE